MRFCFLQPPLLPGVTAQEWARTDNILDVFWSAGAGFVAEEQGWEFTYGEVTPLGARQLATAMFAPNIANCGSEYARAEALEAVVFVDLGSGAGRLAAQMFLDNPFVRKAVGVELSAQRHAIAEGAVRRLAASLDEALNIHYIHGNALKADLSDATHIFISSLCFPAAVVDGLSARIARSDPFNSAPNVRVVASLSALHVLEQAGWERRAREVQMSWGSATVYTYHLCKRK